MFSIMHKNYFKKKKQFSAIFMVKDKYRILGRVDTKKRIKSKTPTVHVE